MGALNLNKANLRDLMAAAGPVILLKLDSNRWFFGLYDHLETLWMTLKNNKAPILFYFKLCASFHNHRWECKLDLQSGNEKFGSKLAFSPCDVEIWWISLTPDISSHLIKSAAIENGWHFLPKFTKSHYDLDGIKRPSWGNDRQRNEPWSRKE